jgi:hypothetical protein
MNATRRVPDDSSADKNDFVWARQSDRVVEENPLRE